MLKITIPTPCHADWNKMTPNETGRHCSSCAKSVVDFTNMSDDEVKYFFINKKEDERVCGRFKQTQLHTIVIELPQNILHMQMPPWKKFLAACLLVFSTTLFSCETKIKDKEHQNTELNDLTGVIMMPQDSTVVPLPPPPPPVPEIVGITFCPPKVLQGDIALIQEDSVTEIDPSPLFSTKGEVDATLKDTTYTNFTEDTLIMGLPIKPVKTKNPPKADSINCNTIKNYY